MFLWALWEGHTAGNQAANADAGATSLRGFVGLIKPPGYPGLRFANVIGRVDCE